MDAIAMQYAWVLYCNTDGARLSEQRKCDWAIHKTRNPTISARHRKMIVSYNLSIGVYVHSKTAEFLVLFSLKDSIEGLGTRPPKYAMTVCQTRMGQIEMGTEN